MLVQPLGLMGKSLLNHLYPAIDPYSHLPLGDFPYDEWPSKNLNICTTLLQFLKRFYQQNMKHVFFRATHTPVAATAFYTLLHFTEPFHLHIPFAIFWEAGRIGIRPAIPAARHHCYCRQKPAVCRKINPGIIAKGVIGIMFVPI